MKKKALYCAGAYILIMQMLFSAVFPCYAAQDGAEAFSQEEGRPKVTSVSISPGTAVVSKNAACTFTATVAGENNYSREVAWSVSGQTSQNTFIDGNGILNVASDETASSLIVKAVSKQDSNFSATALVSVQASTYYIRLQASPDNGGSVFGSGAVKEGGYAVITATPNDGFTFEGWLLNNNRVSQDARYVVDNIRSDVTYVAEFKPMECRITVNVNDGNAGTATEGRTVKYGEGITLEATPKDGYQFDGWTENGNTVSRDSRMQVDHITGDRTFTAVFKKKEVKTYTITASVSSAGGTITPEGKTTVTEGSGVLYTVTPKSGYAIRTVYVDGKEIGKTASFNFSDVRGDHTISADFVEAPGQGDNSGKTQDKTEVKDDPEKKPKDGDEQKGGSSGGKTGDEDGGKEKPENTDGEEKDKEQLTGTLAELRVSVDEAMRLIRTDEDEELLDGARNTGDLQLTVRNDFMDSEQESYGVPDFEKVPKMLLSGKEELEMLQGRLPVTIDLYIKDTEGKETQEVREGFEEKKLPGMEIGRHFEISLKETKGKETQTVSELPEKLKVAIRVPEPLKAENRRFYILRLHTKEDGSRDFAQLTDEDDSPDTITFSTDKLSSCAIAYFDWETADASEAETEGPEAAKGAANDKSVASVAAVLAAALAVGVISLLVGYVVVKKRR